MTLIELLVTMTLLAVVIAVIAQALVSGTRAETGVEKRVATQTDARTALAKMRLDMHCAYDVQSVVYDSTNQGFTISLTEFYNTCQTVDSSGSGSSQVQLQWCTVKDPNNANAWDLYRGNLSSQPCSPSTATLMLSDVVVPPGGWPGNANVSPTPANWNGNIWPTPRTCQTGFLKTQAVDFTINSSTTGTPNGTYELKDEIALRNSTRCGSGSGGLTQTGLTVSAPAAANVNQTVAKTNIYATLTGSVNPTSQITFKVYGPQASNPTDCTTGGTVVGTASPSADGNWTVSNNWTPSTTGTYWWYVSMPADPQNNAANSVCSSLMTSTVVTINQSHPSITLTAPATDNTNVPISGSAIVANFTNSSGAVTAQITYKVFGPQATAPTDCSAGTTVGTASPNGNGNWSPGTGYTPTTAGTYWWYATFPGDTNDTAASSTCGAGMASTTVSNDTFGFSVPSPGSPTAGSAFTVNITAQLVGGGTDFSYSGTKTLVFSGISNSPGGTGPTYPATVMFSSGIATGVSITAFNAASTTLTATQGAISGSSSPFTVGAGPTSKFTVANPGAQTAGMAFGIATIAATDTWGNSTPSYAGTKALTWSGAANSPNNTAPTYAGATSVTFTNGVGTVGVNGITLYNAASTNLTVTATVGGSAGSTGAFAVAPAAAQSKTLTMSSCPGTTKKNTSWSFNVTRTAADSYGNDVTSTLGAVTVNSNYSDDASSNKGSADASQTIAAGQATTGTAFNVNNPKSSGVNVSLYVSATGYTSSSTCNYKTSN